MKSIQRKKSNEQKAALQESNSAQFEERLMAERHQRAKYAKSSSANVSLSVTGCEKNCDFSHDQKLARVCWHKD